MTHPRAVIAIAATCAVVSGSFVVIGTRDDWFAARLTAAQSPGAAEAGGGLEAAASELRQNRPFDALLAMQKESGVQTARHQAIRAEAYARLGGCQHARRWIESLPATDPVRALVDSRCPPPTKNATVRPAALLERLGKARLRPYRERPLTEIQRKPMKGEVDPALDLYPALTPFLIVALSPRAERMFAVSVSSDLDPRGEISIGGYWLHLSDDGGMQWQGPYYMGFAHQYPYVVERAARGVSFNGARAFLEVERREVDDSRITFPPVALRTKGRTERMLLEVDVAEVRRDTDRDGLTDLFEEKLVLNSSDSDTDGDGIPDDRDPLPLMRKEASSSPETDRLWERLIEKLFEGPEPIQHQAAEPGASPGMMRVPQVFHSDRTLFLSGPSCPIPHTITVRAICFDSDTFARYNRKFGVHFPLDLPEIVFDPERRRALIDYNFGWTGGAILATRTNDDWELQQLWRMVT